MEIDLLANASFQSAFSVGLLVIARMVFRRNWAAWSVLVYNLALNSPGLGAVPWVVLLLSCLQTALDLATLYRFGPLSAIISGAVGSALGQAPLTLDPSRWYFWRGAPAVIFVLALAVLGFQNVLGDESLLPEDALDA